MNFSNELNKYMDLLDCNSKDISAASGLSPAIISRYLNGKRTPKINSIYFNKIVESIYKISKEKNINLKKNDILNTLTQSISSNDIDYDIFINNFNTLLLELKFNISNLATAIGYDTSFISRIKNKDRRPSDLKSFIDKLCEYVITNYQNDEERKQVALILKCSADDLLDKNFYKNTFINWITSTQDGQNEMVKNFLSSLDSFNLNDYIGTDFSKVRVPTSPIILKSSKTFYGAAGRKQAEGEFLKTTLLSKSKEPIFFYSDLPMAEAGKDEEFKKKWILAITMLLKKGLPLNMVHNLNRPIDELLLGLESWIPIYMTGSITPYYFKNPPSNFFCGSHCTSGSVALSSECIKYDENKSKFFLTTKKDEVEFEKEKSKFMLSKAIPLMKIFKEEDKEAFEEFLDKENNANIQKIEKDCFKNINFCINGNKWIMINKNISPEIHFVIYHEKLVKAIKEFLNEK